MKVRKTRNKQKHEGTQTRDHVRHGGTRAHSAKATSNEFSALTKSMNMDFG